MMSMLSKVFFIADDDVIGEIVNFVFFFHLPAMHFQRIIKRERMENCNFLFKRQQCEEAIGSSLNASPGELEKCTTAHSLASLSILSLGWGE